MDSNSDPALEPSQSSNFIVWMIVIIIIGLVIGGGYWYYQNKILYKNMASISPSPETSVPSWKDHSEKTMNDFLGFWANSSKNSDGQVQAKKARDLMTIAAQGILASYKGSDNNLLTDVSAQLDKFIGIGKTQDYKIVSSREIDDSNVDIKVNFGLSEIKQKVFTLTYLENLWLIDSVTDAVIIPSPIPTISPTITISPSKTP